MPDLLRGREAYQRREWRTAWESLSRADDESPLEPADLWLLGIAAYLIGRDDAFLSVLHRAQRLYQDAGNAAASARCAFWLAFYMTNHGDSAQAAGWFGRAARLLDDAGGDGAERGYLLLPTALQRIAGGDAAVAAGIAAEAAALGQRFGDRDLLALGLHLQGRALIAGDRVKEGLALLDEAMVGATADELSPLVTGIIYCSVISACRSVYALGRAHEWTAALAGWCERQPDLVTYSGECCVYRSELLQFQGAWPDAIVEAERAGERLSVRGGPAAALAFYQQGEMQRMRGDFAAAERSYRAANQAGREPQPGLALLRLAQGAVTAAAAGIRRALGETTDPMRRARLLPAHVEIMVAAHALDEARSACAELGELAVRYDSSALHAMTAHACGAVALANGDPRAALRHLRAASRAWHALDAPYEVARTRLLLYQACRALGDHDGAALELDAARTAFEHLGAAPDAARANALARSHGAGPNAEHTHRLTEREREVLALVATGRTSRAIADELSISEKTVARHLSNIYAKLGVQSRAAATAYAYEHGLVRLSARE